MAHPGRVPERGRQPGPALTPNQIGLLTRYATRIALAYDVDPAGGEGRHGGGDRAGRADRPAPGRRQRSEARGRARRPACRRQGPGRGRPRRSDGPQVGGRAGQAARRIPDRPPCLATRSQDRDGADRVRRCSHPSIRDIADPLRRDEALQRMHRVSGVDERVLRQSLERRLAAVGPGRRDGTTRITADAVLASPDALPVGDILKAVTPVEAELLRLLLLVPEQQIRVAEELGPDQLPARSHVSCSAPSSSPGRRTTTGSTRRSTSRASSPACQMTRSAPSPRRRWRCRGRRRGHAKWPACSSTSRTTGCAAQRVRLETALAEAERERDAETVRPFAARTTPDRRESSIVDRRREQDRLLARPVVAAQSPDQEDRCRQTRSTSNSSRPCSRGRAVPRPISKRRNSPELRPRRAAVAVVAEPRRKDDEEEDSTSDPWLRVRRTAR